jgi:23S rRNA pseudouridine1911/1915/1917 synthase
VNRVRQAEEPPYAETHHIEVEETSELRLDRFLADKLTLSRSYAVTLIESGRVRVAGRVVKKSYLPAAGDVIEVEVPPPEPLVLEAEDIPVDVLYEDEGFLVVKPS